jgi:hypothetical protein
MTDGPLAAGDIAPGRVLVAGDWHGNRYWALNVIRRVPPAPHQPRPPRRVNLDPA